MNLTRMYCEECGRSKSVGEAVQRELGTREYLCDVCKDGHPPEEAMMSEEPDAILD